MQVVRVGNFGACLEKEFRICVSTKLVLRHDSLALQVHV